MDVVVFGLISVAVIVLAIAVLAAYNKRRPNPKQPLPGGARHRDDAAHDPEPQDRPAGADAESMAPRTGQLEPGEDDAPRPHDGAPDSADRSPPPLT